MGGEMSRGVFVLWLIFAAVFGGLGIRHWIDSGKDIPAFEVKELTGGRGGDVEIFGVSVDEPLRQFGKDFNGYLADQNESNRNANLFTAVGYFLASLTAIFSAMLVRRGAKRSVANDTTS